MTLADRKQCRPAVAVLSALLRRLRLVAIPAAILVIGLGAAIFMFLAVNHDTASAASGQLPVSVIDKTYSCNTVYLGGVRGIEARAHSGSRARSEWKRLPYAVVASGGVAKTPFLDAPPENSVVWITAGRPSSATTIDDEWLSFTPRSGGTIGVNRELCFAANHRIPLTTSGLRGGLVGSRVVGFDCEVPRRVLVRVRAVVNGGTALRKRGTLFRVTDAPARLAKLVVATRAGRVLAVAEVSESGRAKLFTARTCVPD